MKIRNYVSADFDGFIALLKERDLFYDIIHTREVFDRKIEHDSESIIVAEDEGRIVGSVILVFDPWQSFIYDVAVAKDRRGIGLGNKLMEEAEKRLKGKGTHLVSLFIAEDNLGVVEFYKKRGWYVWGKCTNMEKRL